MDLDDWANQKSKLTNLQLEERGSEDAALAALNNGRTGSVGSSSTSGSASPVPIPSPMVCHCFGAFHAVPLEVYADTCDGEKDDDIECCPTFSCLTVPPLDPHVLM